ncbi:HAD family hydrolase [Endozoicomonas arenosclerae]|uniref:HAD family hydrolase n=1 Tax=Endozoicomonas arenosclerae TaxID=1633495 RepID=UPI0007855063|nr:HAD family hydrolase [Endozoicomonas arenosclerae]
MSRPIIFDLDNTLFDFDSSEKLSIKHFFQKLGVLNSENEDELISAFLRENTIYWNLRDEIGIEEVFERTVKSVFQMELSAFDCPSNGGQVYLECFEENVVLEDGANNILDSLASKHPLYVVSNGLKSIQKKRIRNAGIMEYFDDIVVSGDVGFAKPDREIFDHIINKNNICRKSAVYIGDSIRDDYHGAKNADLKYIFYNRKNITTHDIDCLEALSFQDIPRLLDTL